MKILPVNEMLKERGLSEVGLFEVKKAVIIIFEIETNHLLEWTGVFRASYVCIQVQVKI